VQPKGLEARVAPHSFEDRLLKHASSLPRYLLPWEQARLLKPGSRARVRQAGAALTLKSGEALPIEAFWPNLVRTASTPAAGLEGRLIWAGQAGLEELKGRRLDGAIAMVDFNCGYRWLALADLGAKAILFVEPEQVLRGEADTKYLSVPADIPRFWISKAQAARLRRLEGQGVRLDAQVVWERRQARNIVAKLAGTNPGGWDTPVVIEAFYDSISVVPGMAPGAEQACGAAALLELARVFKKHPLKKPILFVLSAGHAQNLLGWRSFLHRHSVGVTDPKDPEKIQPAFVVSLDLSSRTKRLGVFFKADLLNALPDVAHATYGSFASDHAAACREAAKALGFGDDFLVDAVNPEGGLRWHDAMPGRFALDQEATLNAGIYGLGYATPDDERVAVDTPHDTPQGMDFGALAAQVKVLSCALPNVLNVAGAFAGSKMTRYWTSLRGRVVEFDPRVSYLPDRTVSGAMVWVHHKLAAKSLKGVRGENFVQALGGKEQGGALFELHGLPNADWQASGPDLGLAICETFEMDPMDGSIRYALDRGTQGTGAYPAEAVMASLRPDGGASVPDKELMLVAFPCRSLAIFDLVDPLNYREFTRLNVLDARTDSPPLAFGFSLPIPPSYTSYVEPLAMAYAPSGTRLKATFSGDVLGQRGALINASAASPEGEGYLVGEPDRLSFSSGHLASDLCALNDYRITRMKRHGISNTHLDRLHEEALLRLKEAREAMGRLDYQAALSAARAAWGLAARVYPDVKSTASDVVQSAMLFLALLIPFALLCERLLLGYADATKRVLASGGIFMAAFLVLRAVHPAFQIALTPVMILLSFVIIALSVVLSGLIASRFFDFLRQTREAEQGVHRSEVSKVSLALAAFSIGVSNMRKRPLRSFLTCLTVLVLTFAVLSLTSVLQALKQKKFSMDQAASYSGMLFRDPKWLALNEPAFGHLKAELGSQAQLLPRAWLNPDAGEGKSGLELLGANSRRANALAALGATPQEENATHPGKALVAGSWFRPDEVQACILPENLAKALGLGAQDVGKAKVSLYGVELVLRGIFDAKAFSAIKDLDGEDLTPVNFEATKQRDQSSSSRSAGEGGPPAHYLHQDAGQVVILPFEMLMKLGGRLASVSVPMDSPERIQDSIKELLNRLGLLVYVGREGKTFAYSAVGGTATGGLDNLLVPVLIAALIIFSTMLGAVQERRREIGVFSSVGLAPSHVAVLFLAEACAYAVIGATLGYLVGQIFSQGVTHGWFFPGLNVNYSSNAAILAVIIVMGVVLLSTLYPAALAGRLARPSQAVDFTLPPMSGDTVTLELPFSFNARDAQAVCVFLGEYFQSHAEASAGEFSAEAIRLAESGPAAWTLSARVWLAPYDFGVSQQMSFSMQEGIGHVSSASLSIRRISGDQGSWRRVNARFLKDVRKQFLIWRSLGELARVRYQRQAIQMLKHGEAAFA
jgi:hypothetical protein